jgi:hypothetical protein
MADEGESYWPIRIMGINHSSLPGKSAKRVFAPDDPVIYLLEDCYED